MSQERKILSLAKKVVSYEVPPAVVTVIRSRTTFHELWISHTYNWLLEIVHTFNGDLWISGFKGVYSAAYNRSRVDGHSRSVLAPSGNNPELYINANVENPSHVSLYLPINRLYSEGLSHHMLWKVDNSRRLEVVSRDRYSWCRPEPILLQRKQFGCPTFWCFILPDDVVSRN